ncbi:MAG: hypothetical protein HHJ16_00695 [Polaromonas sp.]|uniref:type IV pilus assembly protein FimV n=1 Tax=Polaromonas sp. TaxID=1869339 RepID=UPI00182B1DB8|nr:hypothetical protein [Polaromonas sp.]NMM08783.1 hypothetical protein [Polaromonas sp.]
MKVTEILLKYLLGAVLLSATTSSLAVSLGRMRGATILSRPLNVTLPVQFNESESRASACVSANVFFGDSQIPPSRVSTVIEAGAKATEALIRIQTTSAVDEPIVTVLVREGCTQNSTRKYVLLPEVSGNNAVQATDTIAEAVVAVQLAPPRNVARRSGAPAGTVEADPALTSPRRRAFRAKAEANPSASAANDQRARVLALALTIPPVHPAAKLPREPGQKSLSARLKLDPLDLSAERDPVLRSSFEILTMPSTDTQQRAAAAALWQALNVQPQDVLRDSQRLKFLETEVANILAQGRKSENAVEALRVQLELSRSERYSNWLVYVLGALLMAALAVVFFWTRNQRINSEFTLGPWWRRRLDPDNKFEGQDAVPGNLAPASWQSKVQPLVPIDPPVNSKRDLDLNAAGAESKKQNARMPQSAKGFRPIESKGHPDFSRSLPGVTGSPRVGNAEELFDVQQQADFFVSLGDFDMAVEVLRHHITDSVDASALVYLDLFDLYRSLGYNDDYDLLRQEFNQIFNAQVPVFDEYTTDTQGLEFYPAALSKIESLWPTPEVIKVIEESFFRKPNSIHEVFSVTAYRELLLLHAIAKKIVERPTGSGNIAPSASPAPDSSTASEVLHNATDFATTGSLPLSAELKDTAPARAVFTETSIGSIQPHVSPRLGLDIDLSDQFHFHDKAVPEILPPATVSELPSHQQSRNLIDFDLDPVKQPPSKTT